MTSRAIRARWRRHHDFTPHLAGYACGWAARRSVAAHGARGLSGQAGAGDRAVRGRRQCGPRGAHLRRGDEPGARPAVRGGIPHRRRRQPRRRDGGARDAGRLHAVHRLERPAHRQPVRAGQAQLRSAEGFRRDRARQPRAALHCGASVGAGENAARADRDVEGEAGQHRHGGRGQRDAHDARALQRGDRSEIRACALSRRRRAGAGPALGQHHRRDDRGLDRAAHHGDKVRIIGVASVQARAESAGCRAP